MKIRNNLKKILAIETSCDDTAIAIVEIKKSRKTEELPEFNVLANVVSSQTKIHEKYGGVYPFLAKREHQKNLPIVFEKALKEMKTTRATENAEIDAIAVTLGPGLEPCLWQGVNFANDIAKKLGKPLIGINHIEAHILANFIGIQDTRYKIQNTFPAICLVVSGGHTQLILMKAVGKYEILGETRDDAAGECFDKTARILGLGYPGGPKIAKQASKYKIQNTPKQNFRFTTGQARYKIQLPRPMINTKDYDFSFSGLKTAVLYQMKDFRLKVKDKKEEEKYVQTMAAEIQQAIIDVLIKKTIKAAKDYRVKSIILAGGVSANEELRKQFDNKIKTLDYKLNLLVPQKNLSTDNAVMTAVAAFFQKASWKTIKADANLRINNS